MCWGGHPISIYSWFRPKYSTDLSTKQLNTHSSDEYLTHLPLDKIAAISQMTVSNAIPWKAYSILIEISLTFVLYGSIDNKPVLVKIMAWRRTGNRPLSEPMLTQFIDAYMRQCVCVFVCVCMCNTTP